MTLRKLRKASGKTLKEVARLLCVTVGSVRHYESGIRWISLEQVLILVEVYGESAEDIIKAQLNSRSVAQEDNLN